MSINFITRQKVVPPVCRRKACSSDFRPGFGRICIPSKLYVIVIKVSNPIVVSK